MNFLCSICHDRFEQTDKIFSTKCGHIFHFTCLSDWLKRSSTCPQCREQSSSTEIHRLYFFTSNNDTIRDDSVLQEFIENLEMQIQTRDADVKHFKEKSEKLETRLGKLGEFLSDFEEEIIRQKSIIIKLQKEVKKKDEDILEYKRRWPELLPTKLKDLKDVQTLLDSTDQEADEMISATNNPSKFATYASVLKRE